MCWCLAKELSGEGIVAQLYKKSPVILKLESGSCVTEGYDNTAFFRGKRPFYLIFRRFIAQSEPDLVA